MRAALALLIGWLLVARVLLALDGRLAVFLAWAVPGSLLGLGVGTLARQQRAPPCSTSRPSRSAPAAPPQPLRYQVADDLDQPLAAVVAAAERCAATTPVHQPPRSPVRASRR